MQGSQFDLMKICAHFGVVLHKLKENIIFFTEIDLCNLILLYIFIQESCPKQKGVRGMCVREVYLLFTDTGSYLSKAINLYTKKPLNHVSIGFNKDLTEVYSFGRKQPNNPFIGGFVKENIKGPFLRNASCAIYRFHVSNEDYQYIRNHIKNIEKKQNLYRYNFIGLFGVMLHIKINRKSAYFCSQFVATVLQHISTFQFKKPPYFTTPSDLRELEGLELVYEGTLDYYDPLNEHKRNEQKQSLSII